MSGPKIDYAELERQRQAELERQRQERLHKIREETDKLNKEISQSKTQLDSIQRHSLALIQSVHNADEMTVTLNKLTDLKYQCKEKMLKAMDINVPTEPEAISSCTNKLKNEIQNILSSYYNEVKPLENKINDNSKLLEKQKERNELSKKLSIGSGKIGEIEDFNFAAVINVIVNSDIEQTVEEKAKQILSEIEELINNEAIQERELNSLLSIANNIYKTAFESERGFKAAVGQYNVIKPDVVKNIEIFEDVYKDYFSEYVVFMELVNKNSKSKIDITPKGKYDFDSIEELQQETARIANEAKILSEKNYIREQIDGVMQEFGYNVSKEIILGESHTGNHYLCVNESTQTGIHVYMSNDKQIMMEIVGVDPSNTNSNNAATITSSDLDENEKNKLLEEQGSFCDLHPKIVAELSNRGVKLNMQSRKKPDKKYSKKIIMAGAGVEVTASQSSLVNTRWQDQRRPAHKKAQLRALKYGSK